MKAAAVAGDMRGLEYSTSYQQFKKKMNEARKEFVQQFGWSTAVPSPLWPKTPMHELRTWHPPLSWLTEAQMREPPAYEYREALLCAGVSYPGADGAAGSAGIADDGHDAGDVGYRHWQHDDGQDGGDKRRHWQRDDGDKG